MAKTDADDGKKASKKPRGKESMSDYERRRQKEMSARQEKKFGSGGMKVKGGKC